MLPHLLGGEAEKIAIESADAALMAVLRRLDEHRGLSHFTTWASKFALREAALRLRRRAWQERELAIAPGRWAAFGAALSSRQRRAEEAELLDLVRREMVEVLTPHPRVVMTALNLNEVPIDVLAEQLGTTRGALYKTLHDARKKLRDHRERAGYAPPSGRKVTTR